MSLQELLGQLGPTSARHIRLSPPTVALSNLDDLRAYLTMLKATREAVAHALKDGKTLEQMRQAKILDPWKNFAGEFVSEDAFLETLYISLDRTEDRRIYQAQLICSVMRCAAVIYNFGTPRVVSEYSHARTGARMQNERRSVLKMLLAAIPSGAIGRLVSAQTLLSGVKVAAGQDRFNKNRSIGVSSTTFKVAAADTAGALFAMEQANTKPGGPPRHLHHDQDEFWYVLEGKYVIEVGSDQYRSEPGDCILGPRNIPHAWAFVGESPGRLLIAFTPAGRMQEWFERDRKKGEYMNDADLYRSFGMELLGPPLSLK